ncbi:MAG: hypothetical protein ACRD0G_20960 [Acidimicrobiales bacterium]
MAARGDATYVDQISERVAEGVRRRLVNLREQGSGPDELGEPDDVAARMLATLPDRSPWNDLGPFYSTRGMARVLGDITRQAMDDRRRRRKIVALRTADDHWVYPAFQLDEHNEIIGGLTESWAILREGGLEDWSAAATLVGPQPELDGRSIVAHLRAVLPAEPVLELCRATVARQAR